jgi:hypothetical protein
MRLFVKGPRTYHSVDDSDFPKGALSMRATIGLNALVFSLVACSSPAPSISSSQACTDSVKASCQKRDACSNGAGATPNGSFANVLLYGSESDCESRTTQNCMSALTAPGAGQSTSNIESCVATYANYACTDFRDGNPSGACIPPAGGLGTGAACAFNTQCSSTFCHLTQFMVCGNCEPLPAIDTACTYNGDCGRDMACAIPTGQTTGTCAIYVGSGGACLPGTSPCQSGYDCVGSVEATSTAGTCQAQGSALGAACDRSSKTAANCDYNLGLTCIPAASGSGVGICKALTLAPAGQACGVVSAGTPAVVQSQAVCEAGGECINALCVAYATDGQACDSDATIGPPCESPARCVPTAAGGTAGTCTYPNASACQ